MGKKKQHFSGWGRKRRLFISGFQLFVAVWLLAVEAELRSFVLP